MNEQTSKPKPFKLTKANARVVKFGGQMFEARRESLARDGGSPPRQWYWTVNDASYGSCIDERVPSGYWTTLTRAREVLADFLGVKPEDLRP